MLLLGINHRRQIQADCLAACAAMVMEYLGIPYEYEWLTRTLRITASRAPFTNLQQLASILQLSVVQGKHHADFTIFERTISIGLPVIVAVQTWPLPYWQQMDTDQALVVVGLDDENLYLYDPYFAVAPQVVDFDSFLTAWSE
jgi:ABC-type bacteriocin/lantibiotic exporter with double-glycine peptidase domain